MDHIVIAEAARVNLADLDSLSNGHATANIAEALDVSIGDLDSFIDGSATTAMTHRLGLGEVISAGDELAQANGRDGAIGIIMGILLASRERVGACQ